MMTLKLCSDAHNCKVLPTDFTGQPLASNVTGPWVLFGSCTASGCFTGERSQLCASEAYVLWAESCWTGSKRMEYSVALSREYQGTILRGNARVVMTN